MSRPPSLPGLSGAETLAASAAMMPAATIAAAYALDRMGMPLHPILLLLVMVGSGAATLALVRRRLAWRLLEVPAFAAIVAATFAWLLWIAWPSLLPLGSGSDLTHHLLLIQYIERGWRLVHDPSAEAFLGEMATYTPGSHILAALAGAWSRTSGLHALHSVVAATVALKAGFVFLIALRTLPAAPSGSHSSTPIVRIAFAALAVVLLFASQVYFLRSFVENSFVAQVVSELFAVVMWWSLVVWDAQGGRVPMTLFGVAGAAAFLTWPVWIGPPTVAALALALIHRQRPLAERAAHLAIAGAPIALVAALYVAGRPGWFGMAGTGGAAPWPDVAAYGRWFLVCSSVGLILAAARREGRSTALLAAAIGVQSAALYIVAKRGGAEAPYLALKMFYLLLYPQAVAAALAVALTWRAVIGAVAAIKSPWRGSSRFGCWGRHIEAVLVSVLVIEIGIAVARPLAGAPRSLTVLRHPAVSAPLERAGRWARGNVPAGCVEYLVDENGTAYWLHLAVLGNPRSSARSADPATYDPGLSMIRWLTPGGLPYAIADLPAVSRGVRDELDILQQFGTAAVVRRRGPSSCAP